MPLSSLSSYGSWLISLVPPEVPGDGLANARVGIQSSTDSGPAVGGVAKAAAFVENSSGASSTRKSRSTRIASRAGARRSRRRHLTRSHAAEQVASRQLRPAGRTPRGSRRGVTRLHHFERQHQTEPLRGRAAHGRERGGGPIVKKSCAWSPGVGAVRLGELKRTCLGVQAVSENPSTRQPAGAGPGPAARR